MPFNKFKIKNIIKLLCVHYVWLFSLSIEKTKLSFKKASLHDFGEEKCLNWVAQFQEAYDVTYDSPSATVTSLESRISENPVSKMLAKKSS